MFKQNKIQIKCLYLHVKSTYIILVQYNILNGYYVIRNHKNKYYIFYHTFIPSNCYFQNIFFLCTFFRQFLTLKEVKHPANTTHFNKNRFRLKIMFNYYIIIATIVLYLSI